MACNTCNSPTSGGGGLPSPPKSYLTDPASAPPSGCSSNPPVDPCKPRVSKLRWLADFIPGWLQKLTPAAAGRLVVGVGDALHYFKGRNPGPLYYDGENVTVAAQPTLASAARAESVHELGHLTLAKKVRRPQIMPDGTVADLDFYEHGVQSLGEIDTGHLAGLTIDRTSGQARIDAVKPVERDMVKSGMPCGFRRLGYATEEIDGGCGKVDVEKFYAYRGAVYGDDEIAKEQLGGIPAVLIPVQSDCGELQYRIATPKDGVAPGGFAVGSAHSEGDIEAEYAEFQQTVVRWTDADGKTWVSYKDPVNGWHHEPPRRQRYSNGQVQIFSALHTYSGGSTATPDGPGEVDISGQVPAGTVGVWLRADLKVLPNGMTNSLLGSFGMKILNPLDNTESISLGSVGGATPLDTSTFFVPVDADRKVKYELTFSPISGASIIQSQIYLMGWES